MKKSEEKLKEEQNNLYDVGNDQPALEPTSIHFDQEAEEPITESPFTSLFYKRVLHQLFSLDTLFLIVINIVICSSFLLCLALGRSFFIYACGMGTILFCFLIFTVFCFVQLNSSDGFFMTMGLGYATVGINYFFEQSSAGFIDGTTNANLQLAFNSVGRLFEVGTLVVALLLSSKRFKGWIPIIGCLASFAFLEVFFGCCVGWWHIFPEMIVPGTNQKSNWRKGFEYFSVAVFILALFILVYVRRFLRCSMFVYLFIGVILRAIQASMTASLSKNDATDFTAFISFFRVFSFCFIFTSVGLSMLRTPHRHLNLYLEQRNAALQNEKTMVSWMIEQVPAIILLTDKNGIMSHMNRSALKGLRVKNYIDLAIGHNFFDFFHFEEKEECIAQFQFLVTSNQANNYLTIKSVGTRLEPNKIIEWNIKTLKVSSANSKGMEGMGVSLRKSSSALQTSASRGSKISSHSHTQSKRTEEVEEETIQVLFSGKDITDKIEKEELLEEAKKGAEQLAVMKDTFVANVSHELRTPLNCILGVADLMTQTEFMDAALYGLVSMIKPASNSLLQLIGDLLDYAKLNQGQMRLNYKRIDVREAIENSGLSLAVLYRESGVHFAYRVEKGCPMEMENDENRIRQVILNLLSNAIKFTPKGQILLTAKRGELPGDVEAIEINVEDSGIGIKEEDLEGILEKSWQGVGDKGKRIPGTGIGLAITKKVLELMGGTVSLESEYGKGTKVKLVIPVFPPVSKEFSPSRPHTPTRLDSKEKRDIDVLQGGDVRVAIFMENNVVARVLYENLKIDFELDAFLATKEEDLVNWFSKQLKLTEEEEGEGIATVIVDSHLASVLPEEIMEKIVKKGGRIQIISVHCNNAKCEIDAGVFKNIKSVYSPVELYSPIPVSVLIKVLAKSQKKYLMRKSVRSNNGSGPWIGLSSSSSSSSKTESPASLLAGAVDEGEKEREEKEIAQTSLLVLVVEDNKTNQKVMAMMLERIGNVKHHLAEDGQQAIDKVKELGDEYYDCIFMDYQMPVMDGPTSAFEIRKLEEETGKRKTHITALTANALTDERDRCFEVGMDDYITKPIGFATFTTKLDSLRKIKWKRKNGKHID
eukprot:TRINITY_DN4870_c0_g1_i1.p1 TRINITY_DN4870_c0_g1~~TRINITY_DN4870_c0_g1_i1.p1  ORF type:complete len:1100 (+),score=387.46 TRINITY_DN4870_c0_g1_i1:260-3559(+)